MNLSLPLLTPRDTQSLWYTPSNTFGFTAPPRPGGCHFVPPGYNSQNLPPNGHPHHRQRDAAAREAASKSLYAAYGPSALTQLARDEEAVEKRKVQIARFGATWIKPPGFAKTLQGYIDEEAEKLEQMAMEETDLLGGMGDGEGTAGETVDATDEAGDDDDGEDVEGEEEEGEGPDEELEELEEEEVDLDAEIPEGEQVWSDDDDEEDEEDEEDDGLDGDSELIGQADEDEVTAAHTSNIEDISGITDTTSGDEGYEVPDGSPPLATPVHSRIGGTRNTPGSRYRIPAIHRTPRLGRPGSEGLRGVSPFARHMRVSSGLRGQNTSLGFASEDEMEVDE